MTQHEFSDVEISLFFNICNKPNLYSSANSHTNSIGFQATNSSAISCSTGAGSNCVNIEVFMGTYHRSTDPFDYVPAEGHAALFIQNGDGTENQVLGQSAPGGTRINFSTSHSLVTELPNFDGSNYWDVNSEAHRKLKQYFLLGTNYFFADGSNKALTSGPTNPTVNGGVILIFMVTNRQTLLMWVQEFIDWTMMLALQRPKQI